MLVVGASDNPERYSHKALVMLREHGHEVVPVHPRLASIEGIPVVPDLAAVQGGIDTATMHVGPQISSGLADQLIAAGPRRVIFNPGAENPELAAKLRAAGIACEEACTLVLLRTGRFWRRFPASLLIFVCKPPSGCDKKDANARRSQAQPFDQPPR